METTGGVATIVLEINIGKDKWVCAAMYRPPLLADKVFSDTVSRLLEEMTPEYKNIIIMGDLNYDSLHRNNKSPEPLLTIISSFNLTNLVKNPTCFAKSPPSLLDVILTNRPRQFQRTQSIIDGISDVHATVVTTMKAHVQYPKCKIIKLRSYKKLNRQVFLDDLAATNLTTCHNVQDINDCLKMFNDGFRNVIDDHAPINKEKSGLTSLHF